MISFGFTIGGLGVRFFRRLRLAWNLPRHPNFKYSRSRVASGLAWHWVSDRCDCPVPARDAWALHYGSGAEVHHCGNCCNCPRLDRSLGPQHYHVAVVKTLRSFGERCGSRREYGPPAKSCQGGRNSCAKGGPLAFSEWSSAQSEDLERRILPAHNTWNCNTRRIFCRKRLPVSRR